VTAAAQTTRTSDHEHCGGCCGRQLPNNEVVELGTTPGVFICVSCALWAARRAGPLAALRQLRFTSLGALARRLTCSRTAPGSARAAIPILPSTDLNRTAAPYTAVGFSQTERPRRLPAAAQQRGRAALSPTRATPHRASASSTSPTRRSYGGNYATAASPAWARSPSRTTACASSS
jgi:hypothetical protein